MGALGAVYSTLSDTDVRAFQHLQHPVEVQRDVVPLCVLVGMVTEVDWNM